MALVVRRSCLVSRRSSNRSATCVGRSACISQSVRVETKRSCHDEDHRRRRCSRRRAGARLSRRSPTFTGNLPRPPVATGRGEPQLALPFSPALCIHHRCPSKQTPSILREPESREFPAGPAPGLAPEAIRFRIRPQRLREHRGPQRRQGFKKERPPTTVSATPPPTTTTPPPLPTRWQNRSPLTPPPPRHAAAY